MSEAGSVGGQALYRRVAELHMVNIDRGFLSTLGVPFLSLMYQAIDEGDDSVLLVAREGDKVVGFVSGAAGMGPIYRRMLGRWPQLVLALMPAMSPKRLWRVLEILRYTGRGNTTGPLPQTELLSIAVDAGFRGKGHAEDLYQRLCLHFRSHDIPAFKIVVGAALESAHRFYVRMGAEPFAQTEVHKGEASTVYVHKLCLS